MRVKARVSRILLLQIALSQCLTTAKLGISVPTEPSVADISKQLLW